MKGFIDLDKLFNLSKVITLGALIVASLTTVSSFLFGIYMNDKLEKSYIYILENNGKIHVGSLLENDLAYRKPEILNHVKTFHKLFFNIDQFNYKERIEKALNLIGESGKHYYISLDKSGWYSSLKLNNLVQTIYMDSVIVDDKQYPYLAKVYGYTEVIRYGDSKNKSTKEFISECSLVNVSRTVDNPHGLIIEKYNLIKHE